MLSGCGGPEGSIGFDGNMTTENGTFQMKGEINDAGRSNLQYENVTVYSYSENETILNRTNRDS